MFKPAISAILILSLSACATTSTPDKSAAQKTATKPVQEISDGKLFFLDQADGSKFAPSTGLYCPPTALGNKLKETSVFNESGTDVACQYQSNAGMTTIYLTEAPNMSFSDYFGQSVSAINQRNLEGVEYKEDATSSCMITPQLLSGLVGAMTADKENKDSTINIDPSGTSGPMPYKVAVFGGNKMSSYVSVSPKDDMYMKIRHTVFNRFSDDAASDDCSAIHRLMRNELASVGKPEGAEVQGSLYDLLSGDGS